MMARYNKTHEAVFAETANEITGTINAQWDDAEYFFKLKKTNKELAEENARLRNLLKENFQQSDTSVTFYLDSLNKDSLNRIRKFIWLEAKVIRNSTDKQTNFITLQRGTLQGVQKGDAVVSSNNTIVGVVVDASENYSIVRSMLHRDSRASALLKADSSNPGSIKWDGVNPNYLTLSNVSKSNKVKVGDTVLTTGFGSFPSGLMIGTISKIDADPASSFYTLQVKSATDFSKLQYVYLVENLQYTEQRLLEEKVKLNDE